MERKNETKGNAPKLLSFRQQVTISVTDRESLLSHGVIVQCLVNPDRIPGYAVDR